jgi:predicted N-acetyltransferase YhbS
MRVPGIDFRTGVPADFAALREVDDDAGVLFERAGLELDLPENHEFLVTERERWQRCLAAGTTILAADERGHAVGFVAVCLMDTEPFVAQLSVRLAYMRRGIGGALLHAAIDPLAADHAALWLTTYDHLPWNRPYYERHGFVRIAERDCVEDLQRELALERRSLPQAERRVAMRRALTGRVSR